MLDAYIKAVSNIDVWYTGFAEVNEADNWIYRTSMPFDAERIKEFNYIAAGTIMIKKKFAQLIKFDENLKYGEDWLWYNKLIAAGAKFGYIPMPTLYYRNFSSVIGMRTDENRAKLREKIQQIYTI